MATIKMADSQNTVLTKKEISEKLFKFLYEIFIIYSWEDTLCNKQKKLSSLFKMADFQNGRFEA